MNSTDDLDISSTTDGDDVTITIAGEIDVNSCTQVQQVIEAAPAKRVGLDLSGVGFIDSSGLRSMIAGQRTVNESGGSVRIVALSAATRRLLEITGLLEVFSVE
jgi:anti-anti-sigma factor